MSLKYSKLTAFLTLVAQYIGHTGFPFLEQTPPICTVHIKFLLAFIETEEALPPNSPESLWQYSYPSIQQLSPRHCKEKNCSSAGFQQYHCHPQFISIPITGPSATLQSHLHVPSYAYRNSSMPPLKGKSKGDLWKV